MRGFVSPEQGCEYFGNVGSDTFHKVLFSTQISAINMPNMLTVGYGIINCANCNSSMVIKIIQANKGEHDSSPCLHLFALCVL